MIYTPQGQLFILLVYSMVVGAALGILYDVFRIFRIAFTADSEEKIRIRHKNAKFIINALVFVQDLLFWLIAAIVTVLFIFMANTGQVRLFALGAQFLGFLAYHFTLGKLVMKISDKIIRGIKYILRMFMKYAIIPVVNALVKLYIKLYKIIERKKMIHFTEREKIRLLREAKRGFLS